MPTARIDIDGISIAYRRRGDGPGVVLLHGGISDGRVWSRQMTDLAADFTVVAWDAPGCGGSDDPPPGFRLPDYADCLAGLITALDFDRPHVVGHSFGGGLAIQFHYRHPTLLRSLVLAGAYAGWAGSLDADEVRRRRDGTLAALGQSAEAIVAEFIDTLIPASASPDMRLELEAILADVRPAGARTMAMSFAEADLSAVLPLIDVPTLVIHGDLDVRAPLSVATGLRDAIPGSEMVVIPDVGHETYFQAPDVFNHHLRDFFRRVG